MKDQIVAAIAAYLGKVMTYNYSLTKIQFERTVVNGAVKFIEQEAKQIAAAIAPHLEAGAGLKPTKFEKDNLPEDVKLLFHKGVGLYQCIQNYELGVLTKDEFVSDMRKVESKFKQDTLNPF